MSAENPTPAGLSPERLAEWRALADAATPGPWGMYDDDTGRYNIAADLEKTGHGYRCRREICQLDEEPIDNDPTHADWTAEDDDDQVRADGEFIAAARSAVPELLAEVERLQGHFDTAIKGFNASALEIFELRAERDAAQRDKEHIARAAVLRVERLERERDEARARVAELEQQTTTETSGGITFADVVETILSVGRERDVVEAAARERLRAEVRAETLREAADALDESETLRDLTDDHMHDVNAAANELRRMAAGGESTRDEGGAYEIPTTHHSTDAPGIVAWRARGGRVLRCLQHVPPPAARDADCVPVTAEDLPDGGICTYPDCGADVLARPEGSAR